MNGSNDNKKSWFQRNWIGVVICIYQAILLVFLFAELVDFPALAGFRATNQVLLLVALLFLPFVLIASASVVKSIRVKLQGHDVEVEFGRLQQLKKVGEDLGGRLGDSEQVLNTILAGPDPNSGRRLDDGCLIIGAKEFRSSRFLAHVLAGWIDERVKPAAPCAAHWPNGSTLKNLADLKCGRIDLYVEYTGTGCQLFGVPRGRTLRETLDALNERTLTHHGFRWLAPLGAVDNYRVVVRKGFADEKKLHTVHDLSARSDQLTFCSISEFFSRRDGYNGLCERYRLRFGREELCGPSDNYDRLESGEVDVIIGWDSDARLQETDKFATLEDVERYFPDYHAVPVIRQEALDKLEGLREALLSLEGRISTAMLQDQAELIRIRGDDRAVFDSVARSFIRETLAKNESPSGRTRTVRDV
jgi:glycine betaine/choline ABC-type transport system substrate-binding protein